MDILNEFVEFADGLDFLTKYGIIIANFILIIVLTVLRSRRQRQAPNEPRKRILFVTAHPDDEAMFFMPTICDLSDQYDLQLLCLSNGNSEGLGKVREKELQKCAEYLRIGKVEVVNDSALPDGMRTNWPEDVVSEHVAKYVEKEAAECIITFDAHGISGHANHKAVYRGVKRLRDGNRFPNMKYYQLQSVNIVRKYIGMLDLAFAAFQFSDNFVHVNWNPLRAWRAMTLHASQFVWFRKLFVVFSRYAYINLIEKLT